MAVSDFPLPTSTQNTGGNSRDKTFSWPPQKQLRKVTPEAGPALVGGAVVAQERDALSKR